MQTAEITNPLGLDITWVRDIEQLHDAFEAEKVTEITASMNTHGWIGAPLVGSRALNAHGQDRAYTGSHRWQAWRDSDRYDQPMPVVFIEDICEAHGVDFDALLDEYEGSDFEAVAAAADLLPAETVEAYGLDLDV